VVSFDHDHCSYKLSGVVNMHGIAKLKVGQSLNPHHWWWQSVRQTVSKLNRVPTPFAWEYCAVEKDTCRSVIRGHKKRISNLRADLYGYLEDPFEFRSAETLAEQEIGVSSSPGMSQLDHN
jgi:hypothetical protein